MISLLSANSKDTIRMNVPGLLIYFPKDCTIDSLYCAITSNDLLYGCIHLLKLSLCNKQPVALVSLTLFSGDMP